MRPHSVRKLRVLVKRPKFTLVGYQTRSSLCTSPPKTLCLWQGPVQMGQGDGV